MTRLWRLRSVAVLLLWSVLALALSPVAPARAVAELSATTQRPTVHALLPKTLLVASLRNGDERRPLGLFDAPPALPAASVIAPPGDACPPVAASTAPPHASAPPTAYLARASPA